MVVFVEVYLFLPGIFPPQQAVSMRKTPEGSDDIPMQFRVMDKPAHLFAPLPRRRPFEKTKEFDGPVLVCQGLAMVQRMI